MKDIIMHCAHCAHVFVWTKDEQQYSIHNKLEKPSLCLVCRSFTQTAQKDHFRGQSGFLPSKKKKSF